MVLNDVADKTGFSDRLFDSCESLAYDADGNMYVFPYAGDEYVLWYYNKALFAENNLEVPTTYDELLNCIKVFNDNGIVPLAIFGQEGWISAAMFLNGQWYIEDATKGLGENVDWMFYPAEDAASYEAGKAVLAGGGSTSGYAVNPDSENAELAAEVAAFISEKYCEAKVLYRHNPLVAVDTGKKSEDLPAMMQKLSETIPSLTGTTKFTWGLTNAIFNEGLQTEAQGLISGQFSAEEFLQNMEDVQNNMN